MMQNRISNVIRVLLIVLCLAIVVAGLSFGFDNFNGNDNINNLNVSNAEVVVPDGLTTVLDDKIDCSNHILDCLQIKDNNSGDVLFKIYGGIKLDASINTNNINRFTEDGWGKFNNNYVYFANQEAKNVTDDSIISYHDYIIGNYYFRVVNYSKEYIFNQSPITNTGGDVDESKVVLVNKLDLSVDGNPIIDNLFDFAFKYADKNGNVVVDFLASNNVSVVATYSVKSFYLISLLGCDDSKDPNTCQFANSNNPYKQLSIKIGSNESASTTTYNFKGENTTNATIFAKIGLDDSNLSESLNVELDTINYNFVSGVSGDYELLSDSYLYYVVTFLGDDAVLEDDNSFGVANSYLKGIYEVRAIAKEPNEFKYNVNAYFVNYDSNGLFDTTKISSYTNFVSDDDLATTELKFSINDTKKFDANSSDLSVLVKAKNDEEVNISFKVNVPLGFLLKAYWLNTDNLSVGASKQNVFATGINNAGLGYANSDYEITYTINSSNISNVKDINCFFYFEPLNVSVALKDPANDNDMGSMSFVRNNDYKQTYATYNVVYTTTSGDSFDWGIIPYNNTTYTQGVYYVPHKDGYTLYGIKAQASSSGGQTTFYEFDKQSESYYRFYDSVIDANTTQQNINILKLLHKLYEYSGGKASCVFGADTYNLVVIADSFVEKVESINATISYDSNLIVFNTGENINYKIEINKGYSATGVKVVLLNGDTIVLPLAVHKEGEITEYLTLKESWQYVIDEIIGRYDLNVEYVANKGYVVGVYLVVEPNKYTIDTTFATYNYTNNTNGFIIGVPNSDNSVSFSDQFINSNLTSANASATVVFNSSYQIIKNLYQGITTNVATGSVPFKTVAGQSASEWAGNNNVTFGSYYRGYTLYGYIVLPTSKISSITALNNGYLLLGYDPDGYTKDNLQSKFNEMLIDNPYLLVTLTAGQVETNKTYNIAENSTLIPIFALGTYNVSVEIAQDDQLDSYYGSASNKQYKLENIANFEFNSDITSLLTTLVDYTPKSSTPAKIFAGFDFYVDGVKYDVNNAFVATFKVVLEDYIVEYSFYNTSILNLINNNKSDIYANITLVARWKETDYDFGISVLDAENNEITNLDALTGKINDVLISDLFDIVKVNKSDEFSLSGFDDLTDNLSNKLLGSGQVIKKISIKIVDVFGNEFIVDYQIYDTDNDGVFRVPDTIANPWINSYGNIVDIVFNSYIKDYPEASLQLEKEKISGINVLINYGYMDYVVKFVSGAMLEPSSTAVLLGGDKKDYYYRINYGTRTDTSTWRLCDENGNPVSVDGNVISNYLYGFEHIEFTFRTYALLNYATAINKENVVEFVDQSTSYFFTSFQYQLKDGATVSNALVSGVNNYTVEDVITPYTDTNIGMVYYSVFSDTADINIYYMTWNGLAGYANANAYEQFAHKGAFWPSANATSVNINVPYDYGVYNISDKYFYIIGWVEETQMNSLFGLNTNNFRLVLNFENLSGGVNINEYAVDMYKPGDMSNRPVVIRQEGVLHTIKMYAVYAEYKLNANIVDNASDSSKSKIEADFSLPYYSMAPDNSSDWAYGKQFDVTNISWVMASVDDYNKYINNGFSFAQLLNNNYINISSYSVKETSSLNFFGDKSLEYLMQNRASDEFSILALTFIRRVYNNPISNNNGNLNGSIGEGDNTVNYYEVIAYAIPVAYVSYDDDIFSFIKINNDISVDEGGVYTPDGRYTGVFDDIKELSVNNLGEDYENAYNSLLASNLDITSFNVRELIVRIALQIQKYTSNNLKAYYKDQNHWYFANGSTIYNPFNKFNTFGTKVVSKSTYNYSCGLYLNGNDVPFVQQDNGVYTSQISNGEYYCLESVIAAVHQQNYKAWVTVYDGDVLSIGNDDYSFLNSSYIISTNSLGFCNLVYNLVAYSLAYYNDIGFSFSYSGTLLYNGVECENLNKLLSQHSYYLNIGTEDDLHDVSNALPGDIVASNEGSNIRTDITFTDRHYALYLGNNMYIECGSFNDNNESSNRGNDIRIVNIDDNSNFIGYFKAIN